MRRRSSLRWLGVAPASLAVATGHAQPRLRWNLALAFDRGLDLQVATAQDLVRRVADLTGGKFEIALDAQGMRGNGLGAAEAVQSGRVEMAHLRPTDCHDRDEVYSLGGDVPFGLNSRSMTAWFHQGNGLKLLRAFHADRGTVNFPMGNAGAQMGGWFKKPFLSVSQLAGWRIRVEGRMSAQLLQRMGGAPQFMPATDVSKALGEGPLDGAELFGPYDDFRLGVHRVAPHYCYPSWTRGGSQLELWVNRRQYEALPREFREAIATSAWAAHVGLQAQYDGVNAQALRQLVSAGVKLFSVPKEVLDTAFKESQALCAEIGQRNANWRTIYEDLSNFRRDQNLWLRFTEARFDSFMQSQRL